MSVKAPAEKNFRRAKVQAGARRRAAARRAGSSWRVGRAGCVCGARRCVYARLPRHRPGRCTRRCCRSSRITVHGNVRLSSGEVQAIVDGLRGTSILTADLPAYRQRLLESPWVADVALRRVLPSTVEVFVSERRPMGLCRLGNARSTSSIAHGTRDRRVRAAVRGVRPADHRRPRAAAVAAASRRSTSGAPSWRRA